MVKLISLISELEINNPNKYKVCDWVIDILSNLGWDIIHKKATEDEYDTLVIISELNLESKTHFRKNDIEEQFNLHSDLKDMWGGTIDELIDFLLEQKMICQ